MRKSLFVHRFDKSWPQHPVHLNRGPDNCMGQLFIFCRNRCVTHGASSFVLLVSLVVARLSALIRNRKHRSLLTIRARPGITPPMGAMCRKWRIAWLGVLSTWAAGCMSAPLLDNPVLLRPDPTVTVQNPVWVPSLGIDGDAYARV